MAKRRTFKPELKARVVLEELTGGKSTAEICREHQLRPQVFARWKVEFLERAPDIFATRPSRGDEQERIADQYISLLDIKTPSHDTPLNSLSGGNQQKVLLARWLAMEPHLMTLPMMAHSTALLVNS